MTKDEEIEDTLAKVTRLLAELKITTGQLTDILTDRVETEEQHA